LQFDLRESCLFTHSWGRNGPSGPVAELENEQKSRSGTVLLGSVLIVICGRDRIAFQTRDC
jgi:hypothetical protein